MPLVLQGPRVGPGRVNTPVSIIDIVPTILRFAGAAAPEDLAGIDLRDREQRSRARPLFIEANHDGFQWRAVVQSNGKWIARYAPGNVEPNARFFYDLLQDPRESQPRAWPSGKTGGRTRLG